MLSCGPRNNCHCPLLFVGLGDISYCGNTSPTTLVLLMSSDVRGYTATAVVLVRDVSHSRHVFWSSSPRPIFHLDLMCMMETVVFVERLCGPCGRRNIPNATREKNSVRMV